MKLNNKKIAVGQLVASKTDVRDAEEDEGREDDNVSALELALNHSDTVAVDVEQKGGTKMLHNFRLMPPLISRRRVSQTPPTVAALPEAKLRTVGEEKRDDCTDLSSADPKSLPAGTNTVDNSSTVDQKSATESFQEPLEVVVTPELLSGLSCKRYSQQIKSSVTSGSGNKSASGIKVKGYIRVVAKAPGVKIVSGTTKIVKSYRLGTATPNTIQNHGTLIFSNQSTGMKPTGSLRIRLPPPKATTTNGSVNYRYDVLTFEVGVLTPEGIFPLGTTTYQPLYKSSSLHVQDALKVDPIHRGSIFQRRKPLAISTKSKGIEFVNDKDSDYRLLRKSKLSLQFDIKPLSDDEYMASRHRQVPKSMTHSTSVVPNLPSTPVSDRNNVIVSDELPHDESTPNELLNSKSDPNGGLSMYLSDPLSCCSDRDVESGDEVVVIDDVRSKATAPSTDLLNEDATQAEATVSLDDAEPEIIAQEIEQQHDTNPTTGTDNNTENSGWCYIWPVCCCAGTCNVNEDDMQNEEPSKNVDDAIASANDNEAPASDSLLADTTKPKYLNRDMSPNEGVHVNDETANRPRHRYGDDLSDILRSDSDMKVNQDISVIGTRTCCMACFGDEDVENLKFTNFKAIQEHSSEANDTTDALYGERNENSRQADWNLDEIAGDEPLTKPSSSNVEILEIDEDNEVKNVADRNAKSVLDILDTMSSSYADDEEESVYSVSFSEDLETDGNVGCFLWMDAVSSEGVDTDYSMSVVSTESQSDSLEGIVVEASDGSRIPISKSADVTINSPTALKYTQLQSNSIL